jgi:membrane associated rhomboid family serine protease
MTPAPVGLRCPEHSGKPQGIQKVTRGAQRAVTGGGARRTNFVTLALIAVNVAVVVVELASGSSASFTNNTIFFHGVLYGPSVGQGDWWRVVTAMFLHANFLHIAVNMYSLYWAGTILESVIGRWRFFLLYMAAGIAGSAGALVWSPTTPSLGASGAIFGILGALYVLERTRHISTGGQIAGLIVINLIITFALSSFISVGAHVGGLIGGVVLMWLLLQFRRSWAYSIAASAALVFVSAVIAYAKTRGYS